MNRRAERQRDLIAGPRAWIGPEIQRHPSWIHRLDAAAVAELDAALTHEERRRPLADALAERYRWVRAGGIPARAGRRPA